MNIHFAEEPNLRTFVNQKFAIMAKYTTLPLINQMEIILNDLPSQVAIHFFLNEKFDCNKNDILDFCDAIQEIVEYNIEDQDIQVNVNEPLNRMEVFNYHIDDVEVDNPDDGVSMSLQAQSSSTIRGRGRGRGRGRVQSGRIEKHRLVKRNLDSIPEDRICDMSAESEYDFLDQMSNSSRSSFSSRSSRISSQSARN